MLEKVGRRCVAERLLRVAEAQPLGGLDAQLVEADELVGLARRLEETVHLVREQDEEENLCVMLAKRLRDDAREGERALGDDSGGRAGEHDGILEAARETRPGPLG